VIQQPSVGLADARLAVDAVIKAARKNERPLAVAVVDSNGNMVYQVRQDGAGPLDVHDAERKAITAAYIGRDTSMWRLQIRHDGRTVADWANPQLTTLHGGWTLRRASAVIGGLGVSGSGDEDRDEQLALKGAEAAAQLAVDAWRRQRDPRRIRDRSGART
jgi:glc operon protein GlcG